VSAIGAGGGIRTLISYLAVAPKQALAAERNNGNSHRLSVTAAKLRPRRGQDARLFGCLAAPPRQGGTRPHHKIADMDEPRSTTWIAALPIDPPRGFRDGFASAQERAGRTSQAPCRAEDSRLVRWLCDALLRGQFQHLLEVTSHAYCLWRHGCDSPPSRFISRFLSRYRGDRVRGEGRRGEGRGGEGRGGEGPSRMG